MQNTGDHSNLLGNKATANRFLVPHHVPLCDHFSPGVATNLQHLLANWLGNMYFSFVNCACHMAAVQPLGLYYSSRS